MNDIEWLERWSESNIDKSKVHSWMMRIETLDNPGWYLRVILAGTPLEGRRFESIRYDNNDNDWVIHLVKEGVFEGGGGPLKLLETVSVFRTWAESEEGDGYPHKTAFVPADEHPKDDSDDDFRWLERWYESNCDGGWEHYCGVTAEACDGAWRVGIDLTETPLEGRRYAGFGYDRGGGDWVRCWVDDDELMFKGEGGLCKLSEIVTAFRRWAEGENEESVG